MIKKLLLLETRVVSYRYATFMCDYIIPIAYDLDLTRKERIRGFSAVSVSDVVSRCLFSFGIERVRRTFGSHIGFEHFFVDRPTDDDDATDSGVIIKRGVGGEDGSPRGFVQPVL